jgi:5-methylcytosine-specific restriction endonuclease McrA
MDQTLKREWRHLVMFTEYGEPRPCAHCGDRAVIADHIVPIAEGGALYDVTNGQALCQSCDDKKTASDLKRMRETRARVGVSGSQ